MKITTYLACLISVCNLASAQTTFNIDFRPGTTWDHTAAGGPGPPASNGLGYMKPGSAQGYSSGTTQVAPGVTMTVSRQFIGGAAAGTNNLTFGASNTPGFAFQNLANSDRNTARDGSSRLILTRYQRVDFFFSQKVSLDSLQIGDIDTATSSGAQAWRDAVGIELWNASTAGALGSGLAPIITRPGATRLLQAQTSLGLNYVYANTLGNTTTSNNPMSPTNTSSAFFSNNTAVNGFSMYLWNHTTAASSSGQHAVVLQALGNTLTAVPEPSSIFLICTGAFSLVVRRKRI